MKVRRMCWKDEGFQVKQNIYPSKPRSKDMLISIFNELMEECPSYRAYIPEVTEEIVRDVIAKLNMKVKSQVIVDLVVGRYNQIDK